MDEGRFDGLSEGCELGGSVRDSSPIDGVGTGVGANVPSDGSLPTPTAYHAVCMLLTTKRSSGIPVDPQIVAVQCRASSKVECRVKHSLLAQ